MVGGWPPLLSDRYALLRRMALVGLDGVLIVVAFWGTFLLRLNALWDPWITQSLPILLLLLPIGLVTLMQTGWYQGLTRYSGSHSLYGLLPRTGLFLAVTAVLVPLFGLAWPPRSFWLIFWLLFSVLAITSRVLLRDLLRQLLAIQASRVDQTVAQLRRPAVVYGAGEAGSRLIDALRFDPRWNLVAVIDDDPSLWMWSRRLQGLPIASPDQLPQLIRRHGLQAVLLAIPSAGRVRRRELVNELRELGLEVLTIPSLQEIASGHVRVADLRRVAIEDLLGRDPSTADPTLLRAAVSGKTVLISGGGGSIGSELARQVLALAPRQLILLDHSEFALYAIERELRQRLASDPGLHPDVLLTAVLADVADQSRMERLCRHESVEIIFHAAAYKHVPLVEANLTAGLSNNVLGTQSLLEAALAAGVERFTLISTDKAVRPTNAMGASKRVCELLVQEAASRQNRTVCAMVRFGNVLGSSGSVVPLFNEQIARGGPVTLTHEDITRYFMTIAEAAQLVLLAGSFSDAETSRGGDVFVLDMGQPVRIRDVAVQMIQAAGYSVRDEAHPDGDIEIVVTGLRPGEKLHEELLIGEGQLTTPHSKIMRAREESLSELEMASALRALREAVALGQEEAARAVIIRWVNGYRPAAHATAAQ